MKTTIRKKYKCWAPLVLELTGVGSFWQIKKNATFKISFYTNTPANTEIQLCIHCYNTQLNWNFVLMILTVKKKGRYRSCGLTCDKTVVLISCCKFNVYAKNTTIYHITCLEMIFCNGMVMKYAALYTNTVWYVTYG